MSLRRSPKLYATLGLLLAFFLSPGIAHATPQDITLSPTSITQVIAPGATYSGSFQVINQGQVGYPFQVYAAPYRVSGEDYTPDFTALPNAPNVASWVTFSTKGQFINPGQTVLVHYIIKVPKNTLPGGYYAVAFAETNFPQKANSITLNDRVGEIFYLQAAGPVKTKGSLVSWQLNFFQRPPLTSTIRIEDSGALNFPATISLKVDDIFGQSKYTLYTVKELLPQTIRRINTPWNVTPSIGIFKVTGSVSFLNQHDALATKWVIVMSNTVRKVVGSAVILIILFFVARFIYSSTNRGKTKRTTKKR